MPAAAKKKESKYVTCFADSRADVDITFRDVLLSQPTDNYVVGIDNFSMTNTNLSMIEPMKGDYDALIRIVRRPVPKAETDVVVTSADALQAKFAQGLYANNDLKEVLYIDPKTEGVALEILSGETILSVQQLMHRLAELASDVSAYMNGDNITNDALYAGRPRPVRGGRLEQSRSRSRQSYSDLADRS